MGKFDARRSSSTSGKGLNDVNLVKVALQNTMFIGQPNSVYFCQKLLNVQESRYHGLLLEDSCMHYCVLSKLYWSVDKIYCLKNYSWSSIITLLYF